MNSCQLSAFYVAEHGHNFYIGGQAGTGKSYLTKEIFTRHSSVPGKVVGLTCTTGVACSIYPKNQNPMTIHKWAGLSDGRFTNQQLLSLIINDDRYQSARERILLTDMLIIDEISMLSLKLFDQLEYIMRSVRNIDKPFGGTQLILVGDFLQLPPVRNARYHDDGDFCFNSQHFPSHIVFLADIVRQNDTKLCHVIREVSVGKADEDCQDYIFTLTRPLPLSPDIYTTRLFSQNIMVDMYNRDVIVNLDGELYSFESIDEGEEKYLNSLVVPTTLWLKKEARVMLLRNLSDCLVNGLQGHVVDVREGEVDVLFPSLDKIATLSRVNFTVFDPDSGRNLAVRYQIPLKLSYAITIHKAQGMTLDRVEVDCRQIFQPGQLGVAMGRVKSVDGLRVVNFSKDAVIQQPPSVIEFLQRHFQPLNQDFSCCHISTKKAYDDRLTDEAVIDEAPDGHVGENESHDIIDDMMNDYEMDTEISGMDLDGIITEVQPTIPLPDHYNVLDEMKKLLFEQTSRHSQDIHNELVNQFIRKETDLKTFLTTLYSSIGNLYNKNFTTVLEAQKAKHQTHFFVDFQKFATSDMYKNICFNMLPGVADIDVFFNLCYQILSSLRELFIKQHIEALPTADMYDSKTRLFELNHKLTGTAQGKIRYIAGYVVGKLSYENRLKVQRSAFQTSKQGMQNYEHGKRTMSVLEQLKASEASLLSSDYAGSLEETRRKQNINRGLTNVTDRFYMFFYQMVSVILSLLVSKNLSSIGSDLFSFVKQSLISNMDLFQTFLGLISEHNISELTAYELDKNCMDTSENSISHCLEDMLTRINVSEELYSRILDKTIAVLLKQFSKDLMDCLNIKKKMAHRKQIHSTSAKSKGVNSLKNNNAEKTKKTPVNNSLNTNVHSSKQVSSTSNAEPVVSTSTAQPELDVESEYCAKCYKTEGQNEEWICCDG